MISIHCTTQNINEIMTTIVNNQQQDIYGTKNVRQDNIYWAFVGCSIVTMIVILLFGVFGMFYKHLFENVNISDSIKWFFYFGNDDSYNYEYSKTDMYKNVNKKIYIGFFQFMIIFTLLFLIISCAVSNLLISYIIFMMSFITLIIMFTFPIFHQLAQYKTHQAIMSFLILGGSLLLFITISILYFNIYTKVSYSIPRLQFINDLIKNYVPLDKQPIETTPIDQTT